MSPLNPTVIRDGTLAFHYGANITVLAWSPLGGDPWGGANRLFAVYALDGTPRTARIRAGLSTVAAQLGTTPDVAAIAWLLRHPARMLPILGTMNPSRMAAQAGAGAIAAAMNASQWYHIADAAFIPLP